MANGLLSSTLGLSLLLLPLNSGFDLNELQTRLRKMSDEELVRFGKAARFMCRDKEPRQVFVIQVGAGESGMATADICSNQSSARQLSPLTAASRIRPWLASARECRGRHLSTA
jgi:hypothetical protein